MESMIVWCFFFHFYCFVLMPLLFLFLFYTFFFSRSQYLVYSIYCICFFIVIVYVFGDFNVICCCCFFYCFLSIGFCHLNTSCLIVKYMVLLFFILLLLLHSFNFQFVFPPFVIDIVVVGIASRYPPSSLFHTIKIRMHSWLYECIDKFFLCLNQWYKYGWWFGPCHRNKKFVALKTHNWLSTHRIIQSIIFVSFGINGSWRRFLIQVNDSCFVFCAESAKTTKLSSNGIIWYLFYKKNTIFYCDQQQ